ENKDGGEEWSPVQRGLYESVARPAWGICVAWVIFACHTGCGGTGVCEHVLSSNMFTIAFVCFRICEQCTFMVGYCPLVSTDLRSLSCSSYLYDGLLLLQESHVPRKRLQCGQ
ncbi:hypothetical protein MAR_004990, partial [Mya arenaria]